MSVLKRRHSDFAILVHQGQVFQVDGHCTGWDKATYFGNTSKIFQTIIAVWWIKDKASTVVGSDEKQTVVYISTSFSQAHLCVSQTIWEIEKSNTWWQSNNSLLWQSVVYTWAKGGNTTKNCKSALLQVQNHKMKAMTVTVTFNSEEVNFNEFEMRFRWLQCRLMLSTRLKSRHNNSRHTCSDSKEYKNIDKVRDRRGVLCAVDHNYHSSICRWLIGDWKWFGSNRKCEAVSCNKICTHRWRKTWVLVTRWTVQWTWI